MNTAIHSFDTTVSKDFFRLMVGALLGTGSCREVYANTTHDGSVIKFELGSKSFQNVAEWEIWNTVKDTPYAKWFAECHNISPCGCVLLQERTQPVMFDELPKEIPTFFADYSIENWGKLSDGRIVCHDYGVMMMLERGLTKRMKKAEWWSQG